MIVGGAGGLGLAISHYLAMQQPVRLALVGRRPLDAAIQGELQRLRDRGSEAIYATADVTDSLAMRRVRDDLRQRRGAIHGVIHSALVLRDRTLLRMSEDDLRAVLSPEGPG